jgi:hypothetical protein
LRFDAAEFDAAFIVRGPSEPAVRQILSAGIRKALVSLRDNADQIELTRRGLLVTSERMLGARRLASMVGAMLAIGSALERPRGVRSSAYR